MKTAAILAAAAITLATASARADESSDRGTTLLVVAPIVGTLAGLSFAGAATYRESCSGYFCIDLTKPFLYSLGIVGSVGAVGLAIGGIVLIHDSKPNKPAKLEARFTGNGVALGGTF